MANDESDAAHSIHPLGGQGMNLGFGDVSSLTSALVRSAVAGEQLGAEGYTRDRYWRNAAVLTACDLLYRVPDHRFLTLGGLPGVKEAVMSFME